MTDASPPEPHTRPGDEQHDATPPPPAGAVTSTPRWIPEGPDILDAAPARVYNYALGGMHNFTADRALWDRIEALYPPARFAARANRECLERVTEWLTTCGIRQFLDIGAGIPVLCATHETVHDLDPDARVVYVDIDPIVVDVARRLLHDDPHAHAIRGDLREPLYITDHDAVTLLDFAEPVAVLLGSVVQFLPDDAAARSISLLADALAPGSFLVISHCSPDPDPENRRNQDAAYQLYEQTPTPAVLRIADELAGLIDSRFTLLPPGIVTADQWRPYPEDEDLPDHDEQPAPTVLVAVTRLRSAHQQPDHATAHGQATAA
jgi:SAM-dependent methyltransferase